MDTNIKNKLNKIEKDHLFLLVEIGNIAKEINQKAYLVGGMVRDLLLGFDNLDIDIVVEDNAHLLAETLVKKFPNSYLNAKHDRFHTAKVIFNVNDKNIPIDLASTREETYEHPAALPKVSVSNLKKDLIRRDFTINALAVSLLPDDFGSVVDLFDGLNDLDSKKIKILHDLSFIDDPTRMIRAVRFACKLGFKIEEKTQKLLNDAIKSKQFDNLIDRIRGDRVKIEIRYLFNLPNIEEAVKIFFESGVCRIVNTSLRGEAEAISLSNPLLSQLDCFVANAPRNDVDRWLICFAIMLHSHCNNRGLQEKIMLELKFTRKEMDIVLHGIDIFLHFNLKLEELNSIFLYKLFNKYTLESILIARILLLGKPEIIKFIDEYLATTSKIKLEITGQDLISMGIPSGKKIGEILDKILELKIKNSNMTKEDEIREAKELI